MLILTADDIWILSTKESFPLEETVVLRSLYHGVSGGKIYVRTDCIHG